MIKRYEKFILEFLETSDSIDAKMNELSDLISNSSEGNDIMYKWENKKDEELVVNFYLMVILLDMSWISRT